MVARWMHDAVASIGPNPPEIRCDFYGDDNHAAGPKRTLPLEQDRKRFLASKEVAQFLAAVAARPAETHQLKLKDYSVTLRLATYIRIARFFDWGGSLQRPKVVNEHAAFRVTAKLQQLVDEPHLVCVGSDVSPALSSSCQRIV